LLLVQHQVLLGLLLRGQVLNLPRSCLVVAHLCCLLLGRGVLQGANFGIRRVVQLVLLVLGSVRRLGVVEVRNRRSAPLSQFLLEDVHSAHSFKGRFLSVVLGKLRHMNGLYL
jgi:hypothetical protein